MIGLYARVSTDDQNIEQQKNYLREYCLKNGLKYRSYLDFAESGEVSDRPEWLKLLKDCENGLIDTILVIRYDRITRCLKYGIEWLEWREENDIKLISVYDGEFMNTPNDVFTFKMKILLSEYELQQTRFRSLIGIERAKKEGKYKGRLKGTKNKSKPDYSPKIDLRYRI